MVLRKSCLFWADIDLVSDLSSSSLYDCILSRLSPMFLDLSEYFFHLNFKIIFLDWFFWFHCGFFKVFFVGSVIFFFEFYFLNPGHLFNDVFVSSVVLWVMCLTVEISSGM